MAVIVENCRYEAVTRYSASIGISTPYFTDNMYQAVY